MSAELEWSLEHVLALAVRSLKEHLPTVLAARTTADAARPEGEKLFGPRGLIPPVYVGGMPHDDLAVDSLLPAVYVTGESATFVNDDASSLLRATSTIRVVVAMSEHCVGTSDAQAYLAAITAYAEACNYILSTVFTDDPACKAAGVSACIPTAVSYDLLTRTEDGSMFLRFTRASVNVTHRKLNQWVF